MLRYDWLIFKSCIREAHKCIIIFIININIIIIIIIIVIIIISDTSKSKLYSCFTLYKASSLNLKII